MIVLLGIGLISGILTGLVGIGGGVILIPMLMATGLNIYQAVAISLVLQTIPQGLPGLYIYWKNGHLEWKKAIFVVIGSIIGISIGAYLATKKLASKRVMTRCLSVLIGVMAIYLWYTS